MKFNPFLLSACLIALTACNGATVAQNLVSGVVGAVVPGAQTVTPASQTASVSDDILKKRAAFALNTTPDRVTISNRENENIRIDFVATVGKRSHQCYLTAGGGAISDAICSGANSVKSNPKQKSQAQCNELLKQANRC